MKKPQPETIEIWSATDVRKYIKHKNNKDSSKFWDWFFGETPWGDSNLLDLEESFGPDNEYNELLRDFFKEQEEYVSIRCDF